MSVLLRPEEAHEVAELYGGQTVPWQVHGRDASLLLLEGTMYVPQRLLSREGGVRGYRQRCLDFLQLAHAQERGGLEHVLSPQKLRNTGRALYGLVPYLPAKDLSDPALLQEMENPLEALAGMCQAVQELQTTGFLHLDDRLENFLWIDGEVIATDLEEARRPHTIPPRTLPKTGLYDDHWPPEKRNGGEITAATDSYMIAYEYCRLVHISRGENWRSAPELNAVADTLGAALSPHPNERPSVDELRLAAQH